MTGSIALDVVIGMVFIYLLYSLFATVIMEMITSFLGLRARNLRYALRRMLMDERVYEDMFTQETKNGLIKKMYLILNLLIRTINKAFFNFINSFIKISGKAGNLKNPEAFRSFYNQPTIKYLSSGGFANKPSYLTSQNFSKALLDTLKSDSTGKSSLAKIKAGIDSLADGSHTKEHLKSLLEDANNDLIKFKLSLEQWFEDTMVRSRGWFKRRIQYILFIIGFILAVNFNANTLDIIKKLSKDPEARQQLVDMAINYSKENKETVDYVNKLKNNLKSTDTTYRINEIDSLLLLKIDTLLSIKKSLSSDINEAQNILSSNWRLSNKLMVHPHSAVITDYLVFPQDLCVFPDSVKNFKENGSRKTVFLAVHKSIDLEILKRMIPKNIYETQLMTGIIIKPSTYKWKYVWNNLWGYVLTALAISLGSPFWFDLLNKLIKLRSSVSQTGAKQPPVAKPAPNDPTSPQNRIA